jgi:hypothetical protein
MGWVMVAALVAAALLVGLGFVAFWPLWPPIEPGAHRAERNPAHPANPAPAPEPPPRVGFPVPGAEEWMWTTDEARRTRAKHRHENLGEGTQRLQWYERPSGPQPIRPLAPPVE